MAAMTNPLSPERENAILEVYAISTVGGFQIRKGNEDEKTAYVKAASHLLSREVEKGRLKPGQQNEVDLSFQFKMGTARYKDPLTQEEVVIDLLSFHEGEIKAAVEDFFKAAGQPLPSGVRAYSKESGRARVAPLIRETKPLAALPNGQPYVYETLMPKLLREQSTREARVEVASRLHFVEFTRRKLLEGLEGKIEEKTAEYTALSKTLRDNPENRPAASLLQKELSQLAQARTELEELDYNALGRALAAYPTDGTSPIKLDPKTLQGAIEGKCLEVDGQYREALRAGERDEEKIKALQAELKHLKKVVRDLPRMEMTRLAVELERYPLEDQWLKDLAPMRKLVGDLTAEIRGQISSQKGTLQKGKELLPFFAKQDLTEKELDYIHDVVGMLYFTRWDYGVFCQAQHLKGKKEGVADILLREAVTKGKELAKSRMSEVLGKQELKDIATLAAWEIGEAEEGWYEIPAGPVGLGEEARKELENERESSLKADLKAQLERIKWDTTIEDLPVEVTEPPASRDWGLRMLANLEGTVYDALNLPRRILGGIAGLAGLT